MTKEIEALGGQFLSSSSRETIMYQSTTYTHSLPSVLSILSDTVLNPCITHEELDAQRESAAWEIGEIKTKPEMILPEILHEVAYKDNTLGNPLLCPEDRLETMTPETIKEYLGMWYKPERIVVAAAGVEHEAMVELAERYFGGIKPQLTPSASSSIRASPSPPLSTKPSTSKRLSTSPAAIVDSSPSASIAFAKLPEELTPATAVYTDGELFRDKPELDFTHVYVGYESLSFMTWTFTLPQYCKCRWALEEALGEYVFSFRLREGKGTSSLIVSFSPGGPGEGVHSRLYTSVLNQNLSDDLFSAFHHPYHGPL
jgi:processing peptidase subunit alpha